MRILTVRQPWARLIAEGVKKIENRKWQTPFRGDVAIHAGKKYDPNGLGWWMVERGNVFVECGIGSLGAIVAVAELKQVWNMTNVPEWARDHKFTDLGCGHKFWYFVNVRVLKRPLEFRGNTGLMTLSVVDAAKVYNRITE